MSTYSSSLSPAPASSPLSDVASRSPSPPVFYPSPPASNESDTGIASKRNARDASIDRAPPAKRQKIIKTRNMKTEYLDLFSLNTSDSEDLHKTQDLKVKRLMEVLRTKRKIVVFAGAGISVSAGIPDFRSSKGLFATLRAEHGLKGSGKQLFDADVYRNDASTSSFHAMVRELSEKTRDAKPTPFHDMLATLAEEGRLMRLYTQNVDGIDVRLQPLTTNVPLNLKGPWPKAIQLHGGLGKMVCSKCGHLSDFDATLFEGPAAPPCTECETRDMVRKAAGLRSHGVGRLRPRILLYNEHNPDEDAIGAVSFADIMRGPDAVMVVGTSLQVPGIRRLAKEMCLKTRARKNGFTAWINCDPEPSGPEFKDCWDMVVRGKCDDVARMVGLPKWDDKDLGVYKVMTKRSTSETCTKAQVLVVPQPIETNKEQGVITPTSTPREQSPTFAEVPQLKQVVLKFGSNKAAPVNLKRKQKSGRKSLPSEPTKPVNQITSTFTATKATKPVGRPPKPTLNDASIFPGPCEASSARKKGKPMLVIPTEAVMDVSYGRSETISPVSRPNGMETLLD